MARRRRTTGLLPEIADIPLVGAGLPEMVARGPVKKGVKKQPRRIGGVRPITTQPAVSPLAEAAAQVDLSGRGRTGQELYAQPGGPVPPEQTGMDAASQEYVQSRTREPFTAAILSPFAQQQYLMQEASRLRRRRNVAESEVLGDLRTEARREDWTERRERGGRPSNRLTETAAGLPLVERNPPGMRFAPEPATAQQQQDDWVAERRFGEQAARNLYGADINASEVWSGIARKQAAGQSLTDLEIDAVAWVRAQTRSRQRGGF